MPLLIKLCIFLLLIEASHASIHFDGSVQQVPLGQWQILESDHTFSPQQWVANPDVYQWRALFPLDQANFVGRRVFRLDLTVSYSGKQFPLLYIPHAYFSDIYVGVMSRQKVFMWEPLNDHMLLDESDSQSRMSAMISLRTFEPGDYQLLLQVNDDFDLMALRDARLYLNREFITHEYPSFLSGVTGILGALMAYVVCCLAIVIYRFSYTLLYAICFMFFAFVTTYLREGVVFLDYNLNAYWMMEHVLPLMQCLAHFGLFMFIRADVESTRWQWARHVLCVLSMLSLITGVASFFFPAQQYLLLAAIFFLVAIGGYLVSLLIIVSRIFYGNLRNRCFALCFGSYFLIMLARFYNAIFYTDYAMPVWYMYIAMALVSTFIFVEYLTTWAREYAKDKTRKTAELARVDLVNRFSHELRTPLNAVIGLADLMKGSSNPEKIDNYATLIQRAGHNLLNLVNDILDFSKLGEKGIKLTEKPVRFDKLMSEVMTSFIPQAVETNILPVNNVAADVPFFILADETRLKQIFSNLVSNAIKFSPNGSPVDIAVNCGERKDDYVELLCSVKDYGRGIPEDMLEKIFEPYTQAVVDDGSNLRGTGLGLPIAKLLIEQMGGNIRVESEVGKGAAFFFNLWVKLDKDGPDVEQYFSVLKNKQILLVSEHPSITTMFANLLRHRGVSVTVAARCDMAPEMVYDVVIVDSLYKSAEENIEWLNQQPEQTLIEVSEIVSTNWIDDIQHPNVHRIIAPISMMEVIAKVIKDLTGEVIDLSCGEQKTNALEKMEHRVLLVDDNQVNLMVASKLLESIGVHCETASSGQQALECLFSENRYSLVLLDCEMPEMSGFEVCRRWREHEQHNQLHRLPVVALTAHALSEVSNECLAAGMDDVKFKPVSRDVLIEVLNKYSARQLQHA